MDFDISQAKTPSILRRLGAMLYDSVLLLGILMLATGLVAIPYDVLSGTPYYDETLPLNLMRLYLLAVVAGFFVYFWTHGGQTLGMRAWRIRVIGDDGAPLGTGAALSRFGWAMLSLIPVGWGLWWSLLDREGVAWHDRKSSTRLVMLQRPERKGR